MNFPFIEYWWFYLAFTAVVGTILLIDLGLFNKKDHVISTKEAGFWSAVWVAFAVLFGVGFYYYSASKFPIDVAKNLTLEFFTGYLIEYSLSIDNIFIFVLVFSYFAIPSKYKHRVLFYGIIGAVLFRALFIAFGAYLMQFEWVIIAFGVFLVFTGIKMLFSSSQEIEPEKNFLVRAVKRFIPVHDEIEGKHFFRKENGKWHATRLFIALIFLEFTDILFAADSVPAIFAVTKEPLIVFTSNILAIMGLRSMYFMLDGAMDKFHLLKYGLSAILIFVGLKMTVLNHFFGGKFPISYSLLFIGSAVAISVVASLMFPLEKKESV